MAEELTEKEKNWLIKRTKAQKFLLILAIFSFIVSVFYLLLHLRTNNIIGLIALQWCLVCFVVGCFLIGMKREANKFIKIIDKLK